MRAPILILCLSLIALPVAAIARQSPPDGEVKRLQAEFRDERARARRLREEAAAAAREITALERQLTDLRAAVGQDDAVITGQRARLRELSAREAALVAQLSRARGRQGRLLSALQMMSRRPPPPLLVPADRAVDTVRAAILMRAMAPALQARAQGLADRQAEVVRVRRLSALNSEQLFTTESARGDRRAVAPLRSGIQRLELARRRSRDPRPGRRASGLRRTVERLGAGGDPRPRPRLARGDLGTGRALGRGRRPGHGRSDPGPDRRGWRAGVRASPRRAPDRSGAVVEVKGSGEWLVASSE